MGRRTGRRSPQRTETGDWCTVRALTALLATLAACSGDESGGDETEGAPDVVASEVVTIGLAEGDPDYLFGDIQAVAMDAAGRVYVADRIGSMVRVYGPDGAFLRQLGREGRGPGEYEWPVGLDFAPDGRLLVRDSWRIAVLGTRSSDDAVPDSVVTTWPLPGYGNLRKADRARITDDGRYLYPAYRARRNETPRFFYLVFEDGTHDGDTLHVPLFDNLAGAGFAYVPTGPGGGRIAYGFERVPFGPVAAWDATARGTVIGGDGSGVLIEAGPAGDTLRVFERGPGFPRAVPPDHLADSAAALQARIDSLPVPVDEVVGVAPEIVAGEWPDRLPAFVDVIVATDDRVWVERWPPSAEQRLYDVFHPDGRFHRRVLVPAPVVRAPPPYITADAIAGVLRDPDTDVERVVVLTVGGAAEPAGEIGSASLPDP